MLEINGAKASAKVAENVEKASIFGDKITTNYNGCRLVDSNGKLMNPKKWMSDISKELVLEYLEDQDKAYLLASISICIKENEGLDTSGNSFKLCNNRARTIYNWIRSEDVFPQDILPIISQRRKIAISDTGFKKQFKENWEEMIRKHHWRIFVGLDHSYEDLCADIIERIHLYDRPSVYIYSRDGRNKIAKK